MCVACHFVNVGLPEERRIVRLSQYLKVHQFCVDNLHFHSTSCTNSYTVFLLQMAYFNSCKANSDYWWQWCAVILLFRVNFSLATTARAILAVMFACI